MRTKLLLITLLLAIFCACKKENNDPIPELTDNNPKVSQISIPTISVSGTSGYLNISIQYQGELISSITTPGDSIVFYYTNGELDSARRYEIYNLVGGGEITEEQSVSFIKKNGKIIQANFKFIHLANDTVRFRFVYNSDQLAAVKSSNSVDTLIYQLGQITDINTYSLNDYGGIFSRNYGELLKSRKIKDYISRPNPYYLISSRLGFPYFSCVYDNAFGAREDYTMECMSNYIFVDKLYGSKSVKLDYDYDEMGRVKAIYTNQSDKKVLVQYQ